MNEIIKGFNEEKVLLRKEIERINLMIAGKHHHSEGLKALVDEYYRAIKSIDENLKNYIS